MLRHKGENTLFSKSENEIRQSSDAVTIAYLCAVWITSGAIFKDLLTH